MIKIALFSFGTLSVLVAGGYTIPETSLNSVALSAANIAHNHSADTAYYNPANMAFMKDENSLEVDMMYVGLGSNNYKGTHSATGEIRHDIDSKSEKFLVPSFHYVSSKANEARVGLSIVVPAGLSKRWDIQPAKSFAEEFTLQVVEINPSVAFTLHDKVALAFGFRILQSEGIVKSSGLVSRDLKGNSIDYGYNLALSYKPLTDLDIALTYRSKVNLTLQGDAKLYSGITLAYDNDVSVGVPLPATASIAFAYTLPFKTTLEFVYERDFWSAYHELDFDYATSIGGLTPYFDTPIAKDWNDINIFRLGITQELDKLSLMAGMVYSESAIPEETFSFELPETNSLSLSLGGRYQISEKVDIGLAALYSMRETRSVTNNSLSGEFSNGNILLVSAGIGYKF